MQRELRFLIRFKSDAARALKRTGAQFKKLGVTTKIVTTQMKLLSANMVKAAIAGRTAGKAISASFAKAQAAATRVIGVVRGLAATLATVGIGFGLIAAIGVTAQFGQAMSRVQAITGELARNIDGTLNPTFQAVTETIMNLGATTVFTASEAAQAFALLSQAGFDVGESISATADVLNLAVVGAIDLGTSANIVANSIRSFGLAASEANRVADIFAATITGTNTNVNQLGEALKFVGPIASSLGVDIEEAAAAIGVLSDAGLKGTLAGTGLRRVLIGLAAQTPKATKTLRGLGIVTEDLQEAIGEEGLVKALEQFEGRTLSAAQAVDVFGLRGGPAFLVLQRGAEQAGSLTEALKQAEGRALAFAEVARDNLAGDLKLLRSVIEDVILGSGALDRTFRDIVQTVTGVIMVFNNTLDPLNENAQRFRDIANILRLVAKVVKVLVAAFVLLKIIAVVNGIVGIAIGLYGFLAAAVGAAATAVGFLTFAFSTLAGAIALTGIGAIVIAVGLAVAAFAAWALETDTVGERLDEVSGTIDNLSKVTEEAAKATGDLAIQQLPALERAAKSGQQQFAALANEIADLTTAAEEIKDKGIFDVFRSDQLTFFEKIKASFFGLALGIDAAGVASDIFTEKAQKITKDGLEPLADELATTQEQLIRLGGLLVAKETLFKLGEEGKALATKLDEANKVVLGFTGAAKKAFEDLEIEIGDLSLGVGEAADLQRKINDALRKSDLVVELPETLVTARVKAVEVLKELTAKLTEAEKINATGAVDNSFAVVAGLRVQVVEAKRVVAAAKEAVGLREEERNRLIAQTTAVFNLTKANKEAEDVRKQAIKDIEKQAEAQKKLGDTTAQLILDTQLEIMLLGASSRERKEAAFAQELLNKATEAGLEGLTEQQNKLIAVNKELERQKRTNVGAALGKQLQDFIDEGTNAAKLFGDLFGNVLGELEDQIVSFVKTGEFNFREFAASILDQFIALGVKLALSGALANIQKALGGGPVPGAPGGPGAQAQAAAALPGQIKDTGVLDAVKEGSVVAKQCCDAGLSATKVLGEDITDIAKEEGTAGRSQEKGLFDGLFMRIDNFGAALGDFFSKIGGQLKTLATSIIDGLKKAFKAVGDAIVNGLQKLGDFITGLAEVFGDVVGEIGSAVGTAVGDIGAGLGQALESVLGPLTSSITSLLSTAATALTDVAGAIIGPITTALTAVATEAVKALAQVVTSLVTAAADIATGAILATAAGLMLSAATLLITAASFMLIAAPLLISAAILQLTAGGLLIAAAGLLLVAALLQTVAAVLQLAASAILFVAGFLLLAGSGLLLVASLLMIVAALLLIVSAVIPFFGKGGISDRPTAFGSADNFTNPMFFADGGTTTGGDRFPAMLAPNEGVVPLTNNKAIPVEMNQDVGSKVFNTTFNITTPDVAGFNKSRGQIEADMERMLQRASERNN